MQQETRVGFESITLRVPRELRRRLRVLAAKRDVSLSELVRVFLERELKKTEGA